MTFSFRQHPEYTNSTQEQEKLCRESFLCQNHSIRQSWCCYIGDSHLSLRKHIVVECGVVASKSVKIASPQSATFRSATQSRTGLYFVVAND